MTARALLARLALGATLVTAIPAALAAQSNAPALARPTDSGVATTSRDAGGAVVAKGDTRVIGPRTESAIAGVRLQVADAPLAAPPVASPRTTRGQALAIVGGAAFLGGIIIGDSAGTVIAVGGLGVGVYGLWLWLGGK